MDIPVPQVEVSKVLTQDRIQQRFVEQTIETAAISLAEKIVEVPVIQTQGKTQQVANTHGQHVVDTVEVEKHIIQEKINQVDKIGAPLPTESASPIFVSTPVSEAPSAVC